MNRLEKLLLILMLAMPGLSSVAQEQTVGLVLSGGGAKGVAHIGVIRALEENHVPISYVAGTSMGAIIGGLYAAGYSPDEMDSLVNSQDFLRWAKGVIEEDYTYVYMQEQENPAWITFNMTIDSVRRQPLLPTSLVEPFQMDFAFMQIFSPATAQSKGKFDNLFVPFRCVAADIQNNQAVVLDSGNLGRAIRASMSFPFYFRPVKINGIVMLDGGMYNNFPADVMLETFYPHMIIGSKVAEDYGYADVGDIISQVQTIMMERTDYDVICESSVLIEPQVPPLGLTDFSKNNALMDSGYVAAINSLKEIRMFLVDSADPKMVKNKRKEFRDKLPPLIFNRVNISGLQDNEAQYVRNVLFHETDTISVGQIKKDYFRLLADDRIAYIYPEAVYDEQSGFFQLNLDIEKDEVIEVKFGGTVSSSPINEAFLQGKYRFFGRRASSVWLNTYIGRFYSSVGAAGRVDFPGKTPFYLMAGTFYNQWDFFKTSTAFFEDKTPSYLIKNDFHNKVMFGLPMTDNTKVEAGISLGILNNKYYQTNQFTRRDTVDETTFNNQNMFFYFERNTLNRRQFPTSGNRLIVEAKHFRGTESFVPGTTFPGTTELEKAHQWVEATLHYEQYRKVTPWFNMGYQGDLFLSNRALYSNHTATLLMSKAYAPMPEINTIFLRKFRAHNYLAGGVKGIFALRNNLDFRNELYVFQPIREIRAHGETKTAFFGDWFERRYFLASTRLAFHSPIGPISLYLNYYQGHEEPLGFGLNIGYIFFNRHTLE